MSRSLLSKLRTDDRPGTVRGRRQLIGATEMEICGARCRLAREPEPPPRRYWTAVNVVSVPT